MSFEVCGGVAVLTLQNPPANAYSYAMMRQLDGWILQARMDPDVHVIVLTGEGERFFCAGADVADQPATTPATHYALCLHASETLRRLEQTPKLVIAALNGHAAGGGLELALACDLRVARRGVATLGLAAGAPRGLPVAGSDQRLTRLLSTSGARESMAAGVTLEVDDARDLGLVHEVLEAATGADFMAQVLAWADRLCPPRADSGTIGLLKRTRLLGEVTDLALERALQQCLSTAAGAAAGPSAQAADTHSYRGR
ncbi:MAG: enoyl-CoA hydratase/isomerase family protein [Myxococcota bacterium]